MTDAVEISDNKQRSRYELAVDGGTAFVTYRLSGDVVALLHAEVPRHLRGQGIGERMVDAVMADIRRRGLKAIPYCSFVAGYLAEHPEYSDLLA